MFNIKYYFDFYIPLQQGYIVTDSNLYTKTYMTSTCLEVQLAICPPILHHMPHDNYTHLELYAYAFASISCRVELQNLCYIYKFHCRYSQLWLDPHRHELFTLKNIYITIWMVVKWTRQMLSGGMVLALRSPCNNKHDRWRIIITKHTTTKKFPLKKKFLVL